MRFEWHEVKNRRKLRKHDVRFETAALVFDDEEGWITVGAIGPASISLVVHTFHEEHGEEIIRIISAPAAESRERKAYEEAQQSAGAGYPRHRRKKRPGQ
jgi:uncharacterized DUF497 family protein